MANQSGTAMSRIIAGVFDTLTDAERTREALVQAGFAATEVTSFFNNAPGQHGVGTPATTGGDETADPQAKDMHKGTAAGAAIGAGIGFVAGLTAGPAAIATAGVGAYIGSLAGTAQGSEDETAHAVRRPAGVMVAVNAGSGDREQDALRVLRECGANNIERAEGVWENGDWVDFDPNVEPQLIDQEQLNVPGVAASRES
jgi:hypothetical protein